MLRKFIGLEREYGEQADMFLCTELRTLVICFGMS